MESKEAVARAVATSGGAVRVRRRHGLISLLCLYFGGIPQVEQLGYSAAIAVAVVIVAALTMLPAGLSLLGRHINSLRVRDTSPRRASTTPSNPNGWARWAQGVGRHPLIAALAGIVVLLVLALPVTEINLGAQDNGQMPESTTIRNSYDALDDGFGVGAQRARCWSPSTSSRRPKTTSSRSTSSSARAAAATAGRAAADRAADRAVHEQLVEEGVPEDEAQEQAQQQATQQVEAQGPSADNSSSRPSSRSSS